MRWNKALFIKWLVSAKHDFKCGRAVVNQIQPPPLKVLLL